MLDRSRVLVRRLLSLAITPLVAAAAFVGGPGIPAGKLILVPQAQMAPAQHLSKLGRNQVAACNFPDGTMDPLLHCYAPAQIAAAYGLDTLHGEGLKGDGQTIVLVDAYGSPTAAADLKKFHDTFFPKEPLNFQEIYPDGNPPFSNTVDSGLSGPTAAALWSGEATLDIEWSYAVAPHAHIILVGVPPAETEGVQGLPNLFKAMQSLIDSLPRGTIFSQSFGVTEQTFGGAAASQVSKFDAVYQSGIARGDTFLASAGDFGTTNVSKQAKERVGYPFPTVIWPTTSPFVTSAGGTQLQLGWRWTPSSNVPFNTDGSLNPAFFAWSSTTNSSEAVWNEPGFQIATGGNPSAIYSRPSWQNAQASVIGKDARGVPDLSWNSAVDGGVLVWISAYPGFNCGNTTGCWAFFGGTSAASPQLSGVVALANQLRGNKGPVGWLNPRLYKLGDMAGSSTASFSGSGDFRDIVPQTYGIFTLNTNQLYQLNADGTVSLGQIAGNPTLTGWDLTTGFGTPRADKFVHDLATQP